MDQVHQRTKLSHPDLLIFLVGGYQLGGIGTSGHKMNVMMSNRTRRRGSTHCIQFCLVQYQKCSTPLGSWMQKSACGNRKYAYATCDEGSQVAIAAGPLSLWITSEFECKTVGKGPDFGIRSILVSAWSTLHRLQNHVRAGFGCAQVNSLCADQKSWNAFAVSEPFSYRLMMI